MAKKITYFKKTFDLKDYGIKRIPINIWDDYYDDGFIPKGEKQETHAYVESNLFSHDLMDDVLHLLMDEIAKIGIPKLKVSREAVRMGPFSISTGEPRLFITNLTHKDRDELVKKLKKMKLTYEGAKLDIYSES